MTKAISFLIPNYNGSELLKENLPSVINAVNYYYEKFNQNIDILIVDDYSTDNSVETIKNFTKKFPFIKYISNNSNKGFGKNCNIGFKNINSDIVILLNTDVKIPENFIEEIIKPFKYTDTFAVSPTIEDFNKGILSGSYKVPYLKRGEIKYRKWKNLSYGKGNFYLTFFCEGGSVAIDRKKFLEINGFDNIYYPFYYEDNDLCIKAWKKNWKCYFYPGIKVLHKHKSTIAKHYNENYIKTIMRRNRFIFLWSNLPLLYLLFVHIPNIFPRIISYSIKFDFNYIIGLFKALKFVNRIKEKRRAEGTKNFFKIIAQIEGNFKSSFKNFKV